jgi:hypothetical protein
VKKLLIGLAAASLFTGMAGVAMAQDTTVIHKESADGEHSKTVVAREDGSKTIIKRGRHHVKKVHIEPNGDKTVVKKSVD